MYCDRRSSKMASYFKKQPCIRLPSNGPLGIIFVRMTTIITYSLDKHRRLFAQPDLENQAIHQISDQLNFSDQSVFEKFFKTNTGLSPLDCRKQLS